MFGREMMTWNEKSRLSNWIFSAEYKYKKKKNRGIAHFFAANIIFFRDFVFVCQVFANKFVCSDNKPSTFLTFCYMEIKADGKVNICSHIYQTHRPVQSVYRLRCAKRISEQDLHCDAVTRQSLLMVSTDYKKCFYRDQIQVTHDFLVIYNNTVTKLSKRLRRLWNRWIRLSWRGLSTWPQHFLVWFVGSMNTTEPIWNS
jgi:hypothetical protein